MTRSTTITAVSLLSLAISVTVGVFVALMMLGFVADEPAADEPAAGAAPSAAGAEWTVLSHESPILRGASIQACITYKSPAGAQERCRQLSFGGAPTTDEERAIARCYKTARIGDPLPDCWR